jgi:hypothetical protein
MTILATGLVLIVALIHVDAVIAVDPGSLDAAVAGLRRLLT